MGQRNRTESREISPYIYGQLIFNKDAKIIQWEKIVFSTTVAVTIVYSHAKG